MTIDSRQVAPEPLAIAPIRGHRFVPAKPEAGPHRQLLQSCMDHPTVITTLTMGQLEASYPLYRKALRILIREGKTMEQIQRSVCWNQLAILHRSLPHQYDAPNQLYALLKEGLNPATA